MNPLTNQILKSRSRLQGILAAVALGLLSACSSDTVDPTVTKEPSGSQRFQIRAASVEMTLVEGDQNGLRIPLSLTRNNGHARVVKLDVRGKTAEDVVFVTSSFSPRDLTLSEDRSEAVLKLSIANSPIMPQQREFIIIADDGVEIDTIPISVSVVPTSAPDVYLLAGQSNMVGFSGDGTREIGPGEKDEPNPRIKKLNVSANDGSAIFVSPSDYISEESNLADGLDIVTALDPLHIPIDPAMNLSEELQYIGMGLSFAKSALERTTAEIVLVPAAWSGSSFCENASGPQGNWMPEAINNPALGNTLLFDRAVTRANLALQKSGGVFRGILWHQGESDANDRCAPFYQENLTNMVEQMRDRILHVGNENLRRIRDDAIIPFVLGTMSRGADARENLSVFLSSKQMIDDVHKSIPDIIDAAALSDHVNLVPPSYPCGNSSCIHFGPEALREMGNSYYAALRNALGLD